MAGTFRRMSHTSRAASLLLFVSGLSFYISFHSLAGSMMISNRDAVRLQIAFTGNEGKASPETSKNAPLPGTPTSNNTPLPEALMPVTFEGCCDDDKEDKFPQTCLTEKACNSSIYPFISQEEAATFERWDPSGVEAWKHVKQCEQANAGLTPQHGWCRQENISKTFPFGCSKPLGMGGGSGPYDRLFLFPQGKLAFCGIPKACITQWLHFLRFTIGAKDYQSIPYCKADADKFRFDKLTPQVQADVWSNPAWTKAILIRDPAERLLSAYLDKVKTHEAQPNPPFGFNVTFAYFIDILAMKNVTRGVNETHGAVTGLTWYSDPHWRPQAWSCGLSEHMPMFDYIGSLDQAAYHSKALLQKVGMWETFGKHYRVTERGKHFGTHAAITWPPEPLKPGEKATGFQQEVRQDRKDGITTRHSQGSWDKMDQYYTSALLQKVRKLYWMDFALWNALQEAQKEGKVHGKDIATKLKPECSSKTPL